VQTYAARAAAAGDLRRARELLEAALQLLADVAPPLRLVHGPTP
jgi:hypothetical protein